MGRMDEMGRRMDDLERSKLHKSVDLFLLETSCLTTSLFLGITDLMEQAGLESPHQSEIPAKGSPTHNKSKDSAVL